MPGTNQPSAENVERADAFMRRWSNPSEQFYPVMRAEIAQALQAVEDAAERRGAVKLLNQLAYDETVLALAQYPQTLGAFLLLKAKELESATKETGGGE